MPMSSQAARALKASLSSGKKPPHDPSRHYLITPTAAIWQGEDAPLHSQKPRRAVRWARLPLDVPRGRCLAVRAPLPGGADWQVCVEKANHRMWLPVEEVLSQKMLSQWVRTGF